IPSLALFRSVQAGSDAPLGVWHIDPVRSSTSITSSGPVPHGEHAFAVALRSILSIPNRLRKVVSIWPDSETLTELAGEQLGKLGSHAAWASTLVLLRSGIPFFAPDPEPNW